MENKDIRYYHQVLLEQCIYKPFSNNHTIIDPDLEFPDSESEEEEINENIV